MEKLNIFLQSNNQPILSWCPQLDTNVIEQLTTLAELPFIQHISMMPDAHLGELAPIGSVIGTNKVLLPFAVGTDCGCGVGAFKTNLTKAEFTDEIKKKLHGDISVSIPFGFQHNDVNRTQEIRKRRKQGEFYFNEIKQCLNLESVDVIYSQIGTVGGGNHFLEIQYDENENIWVMVHSGSRNIGYKFYQTYTNIAEELCRQWYTSSSVPFLPYNTEDGYMYMEVQDAILYLAYANRETLLEDMFLHMKNYFPHIKAEPLSSPGTFQYGEIINIHHNYVVEEQHFGRQFYVHRKGATLASQGHLGIIPGSQSTNSFITCGKGNPRSLNSSSHGSGRTMGRKEFNILNQTRVQEMDELMKSKGIVYSPFQKATRGKDEGLYDISEAGDAYKDVISVMNDQQDLVKPIYKLTPLINWKG